MSTSDTTIREDMVTRGELEDVSWEDWKAELVVAALDDDMGLIDPDDYRDYYDDGYTPSDAWAEDCSHAD